jgi:hypothetical protein
MESKHPKRQVNKALLDSDRVVSINRVMKKVNQATDFLYESIMDRERAYAISACSKIRVLCDEIEGNIEKYLKNDE